MTVPEEKYTDSRSYLSVFLGEYILIQDGDGPLGGGWGNISVGFIEGKLRNGEIQLLIARKQG